MALYRAFFGLMLVASASAVCPMGSIRGPARLSCYKLYAKPMAWLDAEVQCLKDNGHLVSIPSSLTNAFLQTTASAYGTAKSYWLGGAEMAGHWTWIDNSRWSFTKWAKDQPTVGANCLSLNAADGTWYSPACSKTLPFLCSVPDSDWHGGATPPPNVPTPLPPKPCPAGWTFFPETDLCYGVVSGTDGFSNYDAANLCAENDGMLPSITDANMNFRLMSLVIDAATRNDYVQLGLRYNSTSQLWSWMDGRALTYTNWQTGFPKNPDNSACTRMSLITPQIGSWTSHDCTQEGDTGVVCERESGEYQ
ncbi:CRE-CLEC-51 protein [Aphelenchoides avenae]|nr:CRE-CLEC-51 protein [Aphelenchus avenae]